ncbi:MAG: hypothetical protein NVSMB2_25230 [Chloroflexota bacterium]
MSASEVSRTTVGDPFIGVVGGRLRPLGTTYGYAVVIVLITLAALIGLPGTAPSADPIYVPLSLALLAGMMLTIRLAPVRPAAALVLLPAMVLDARFGLAALPAVAYVGIVVNLVRGVRGSRVITGACHTALAFAAAHGCANLAGSTIVPDWVAFAAVFASVRIGLYYLALRFDVSPPHEREERPDVVLSMALAPIALLPLVAGARLGDGALLLATAALLALLFVVREAANLAAARTEMEAERDRLARANDLQDDMIHLITHELRNPLTLVMSYAQMTRRAAMDGDEEGVSTYLGHVDRAARSIQRLMENLLQLSKLERSDGLPDSEAVAIGDIISQVVGDLAPLARQKNHTLTLGNLDVPPVLGVPMLLREALSNLLSNAVKYTPEGGEITVWVERGPNAQNVVIGVRDTGIGLSQADQKRLFTKFFRSADPRVQKERGTGLGLALTHTLVTRGGGTIDVESAPGHGTTFRLTLPVASAT